MEKIKKYWVHLFILLLPFLVFYWQAPFVGKHTIGNDYVAFPIQHQMELQYSLQHGSFPLFIPGFAGGQSSVALTLGQMYHPISHTAAMLPGYWQGDALEWNTFLRLLSLALVHLGLYLLLLRLGLAKVPSFFISFITVYNLRMLDLFRYGASLENYTGLLFLSMAMAFYYLKPSRFIGPASIMAATYLLVCGGHPQMMYLGLLGAGIAGLAIPFAIDSITSNNTIDWKHRIKYFRTIAIFVLCGVLLASVYTIPFFVDFVQTNAQRAGQDYKWATGYSCSTGGLINNFFSPLESEVQGAFGSSPIILLVVLVPLLFAFRMKVPWIITSLWAVSLLIFLCGLGSATPIHYYFWKYFPLANSFRIPARITMLLPFIFMLILAWLFRHKQEKDEKGVRLEKRVLPILIIATSGLFLVYNFWLIHLMPKANVWAPVHIKSYPGWIGWIVMGLGLLSLLLLLPNTQKKESNPRSASVLVGILLSVTVIMQVGLQFQYATWIIMKHHKPSLRAMDEEKKRSIDFNGDPGFGMETETVYTQKQRSALEPKLAMFFRDYVHVPDQKSAYYFLAQDNAVGKLAVERQDKITLNNPKEKSIDKVVLKESSFNQVLFSVTAGASGYFALSYPYSHHWRATVNGKPSAIYRANGYRLAIWLEKGEHQIQIRYWSDAAFAGWVTSCLVFFLVGLYFSFFVFQGKQRIMMLVVTLLVPLFLFGSWYHGLYRGDNLDTKYSWSSDKFPNKNNLAYAKRASMSFGRGFNYAGFAVDGDVGRTFQTMSQENGWWQVDLGSIKTVGQMVIYDKPKLTKKMLPLYILGSLDGKNFEKLKQLETRDKEWPWRIDMKGEGTRFVRIQAPGKVQLAFREVEIYPAAKKDLSPQQLVNSYLSPKFKDYHVREINVWKPNAENIAEVSPNLQEIGQRGKFQKAFKHHRARNLYSLTVTNQDAGKEGQRIYILGFDQANKTVAGETLEEKQVTLIVKARISGFYLHEKNVIFVQDLKKKWQKAESQIIGNEWKTYIVSKTIRKGVSKWSMGIRFTPVSAHNRLQVGEIRVLVSDKEMRK
jgi:Bacterial membrane protein YfhO/NedA-like, galactose-binding domain